MERISPCRKTSANSWQRSSRKSKRWRPPRCSKTVLRSNSLNCWNKSSSQFVGALNWKNWPQPNPKGLPPSGSRGRSAGAQTARGSRTTRSKIILDSDRAIDAALVKLKEMFERRRRAPERIARDPHRRRLCHQSNEPEIPPTAAAYAAGLRDHISLEPMLPGHVKTLAASDAMLGQTADAY